MLNPGRFSSPVLYIVALLLTSLLYLLSEPVNVSPLPEY